MASRTLRRLYAYLLALTVVARFPFWILSNLTPAQRGRRSWNLRKAVTVKVLRWLFESIGHIDVNLLLRVPSHQKLEPGYGGVWVDPAPRELITGKVREWAEQAGVQPIHVPGYWIHKRGQAIAVGQEPDEKEKVVYYLHGGAYVLFSAHPDQGTSNIPKNILKGVPGIKRSFAIEYRLSSIPPETKTFGQFPSALLDAISGFTYLVNKVGFSPSQIIVVGDSAGGNLAQAFVRYLGGYEGALPSLSDVPGALILLSPWSDMSGSHHSLTSSAYANKHSDYIPPTPRPYTIDVPPSFFEPFGPEFVSSTPYLSPACKRLTDVRFDNFPPTFIAAGDAEVLVDQIRELVRRMKRSLGDDKVIYFEAKDAFHDWLTLPFTEPWKSDSLRAISRFLSNSNLKTKL